MLRALDSTRRGLDEAEAQARLTRHGENAVAVGGQPRWTARALAAVRNPFVVILIILTAVSTATGDLGGALVITVMVVISCVLRVRQEYRSDRAAAALRALVAATATVIRRAAAGSPPWPVSFPSISLSRVTWWSWPRGTWSRPTCACCGPMTWP